MYWLLFMTEGTMKQKTLLDEIFFLTDGALVAS